MNGSKLIWFSVIVLIAIQGGTQAILRGYSTMEVVPLKADLDSFPREIGEWIGEDSQLDPRVFRAIGAYSTVNRTYSNQSGHRISLHLAAWTTHDQVLPHKPEICYTGNGWEILKSSVIQLNAPKKPPVKVRLLEIKKESQRAFVLYWYQLDGFPYFDRDGGRIPKRELWGNKICPPIIKMMLSTPANNRDELEKYFQKFAEQAYAWCSNVE